MNSLYNAMQDLGLVFINKVAKGASYIMQDGLFLDLFASKDIVIAPERADKRFVTHPQFVDYLVRVGLLDRRYEKPLLDSDNAIAINDGTNYIKEAAYICLPPNPLASPQYEALLNWLTYVMTISPTVQIETKGKIPIRIYPFASVNNENGFTPEDIIKDIKRMYNQEEEE